MARLLRRGEIYWADLRTWGPRHGPQTPKPSERPGGAVALLEFAHSHDVFNGRSGTVIAVAITSQPQRVGFPLSLRIESVKMPKPSWVKISQIRTLSTERLGRRVGAMAPEELTRVTEGLFELVG